MYSGLLVCAVLGLVFQFAIDLVERVLIPWKPR
jgi:ABC-type nitrate/sulfonate/bicarbonate transport system permease component